MRIGVGTTSELKLRAVRAACNTFGIKAEVFPCEVPSGVSEQPFGLSEILAGARNRAEKTAAQGDFDYAVGIENGLFFFAETGKHFDVPIVYMLTKDLRTSVALGTGVAIPETWVERTRREKTDLGGVVQSLNKGGEKDPVACLSGGRFSREDILKQTILPALNEVLHPESYSV